MLGTFLTAAELAAWLGRTKLVIEGIDAVKSAYDRIRGKSGDSPAIDNSTESINQRLAKIEAVIDPLKPDVLAMTAMRPPPPPPLPEPFPPLALIRPVPWRLAACI